MRVCVSFSQLTGKMAINELFSNITWTTGQAEDMEDEAILSHWQHPLTNVYVTLVLNIIMNVGQNHDNFYPF